MANKTTRTHARAKARKATGASHPALPTFKPCLEGVSPASLKVAPSIFPRLSIGEGRIVAMLALSGNNAPHRKVATALGLFHKVATPKGCRMCRATMGEDYNGRCAGNDGWTRVVVSTVSSDALLAKGGSRADRLANLWAWWFMALSPAARAAEWARLGHPRKMD